MKEFREELIQAIQVVATTTNMTVSECIEQALEILKKEQKKYRKHEIKQMFRKW